MCLIISLSSAVVCREIRRPVPALLVEGALLLLLILFAGTSGMAQMPGLEMPSQPESYQGPAEAVTEQRVPALSASEVSGESVVELSNFISAYIADSGQLPQLVQVKAGDGSLRVLSASEAFILLARTVGLWRTNGELPAAVSITPAAVAKPDLDPEDVPQGEVDVTLGREVPTEPFLDQTNATVRWVDQLRKVPTAIWVQGERLSAAQYLAGLAICLEYAYQEGGLLDTIFLPSYAPPAMWMSNVRFAAAGEIQSDENAYVETEAEADFTEQVSAGSGGSESGEVVLPFTPIEPEQFDELTAEIRPQLSVIPEPGAEVSGVVELVASYSGPAAFFVIIYVDGVTRAIMNVPPYGYHWDTTALPPGIHTIRVQVLGEENVVLADQVSVYTVVSPDGQARGEEPPEEF